MYSINQGFECRLCHRQIPSAYKTCRNHCPYCFASSHVDDRVPGDRQSVCHGLMLPDHYIYHSQYVDIHFVCIVCGHTHNNKQSEDDDITQLDHYIGKYRYHIATSTTPDHSQG